MKIFTAAVIVCQIAPLGFAASPPLPAPNIVGEEITAVAERTGYSAEEIDKLFPPIEEWGRFGVTPAPGKIADTFARDRFKAPPAPYVHPRIYFNPEDVPEIRRRLKETQVGRLKMAAVRGRLLQISPKREDWEGVPYKPKDEDHARYAARGMHIDDGRKGFRGPWVGGWVNELAQGNVPPELDEAWDKKPGQEGDRGYMMHLLPYEAFRCLIDDDAPGGRRVSAALTTIAKRYQKSIDRYAKTDDWQQVYQYLQSQSIGLTYDWAYQWLTGEQRGGVRQCIADLTRGKTYLGNDHPPGFPGNTSNWNVIHANLLPMVLAIEGEEGYDPLVYRRIVEGLRKWVYVASGPRGAPFEGLNKSYYGARWLPPLAKRGEALIGTEYSRAFARQFLLHTMLPWGGQHVFETGIHPLRKDIGYFKHAHPQDPAIDLLYAATVKDQFTPDARGTWDNIRTTYAPAWDTFVADDPIGAKGDSYDYDKAFDRVMAELRASEPLTYYSDYRGLLIARSAWERDAAFLYFEPRNVPGGHTRASRNEFVFAALGRLWAHRTEDVEDTSELHSVILIDGKGQGKTGGRCPAGRTVALADTAAATFAAADAAWAYSRVLVTVDRKGAQPVGDTPNDSRLQKSPLPWMDRPWSFLPNWNTGCRPAPKKDPGGHGYYIPYNPVQYAYRTAGLVRGKHPYALIVDDIKKDNEQHRYDWLMQVPDDLKVIAKSAGTPGKDQVLDLILGDEEGRRLLVRVLAAGATPAHARFVQTAAKLETIEKEFRNNTIAYKRLVLPLEATAGRYKVLLYPHRQGEPLPNTAWSKAAGLTISWPDHEDRFNFTAGADGRTRIELKRNKKTLLDLR